MTKNPLPSRATERLLRNELSMHAFSLAFCGVLYRLFWCSSLRGRLDVWFLFLCLFWEAAHDMVCILEEWDRFARHCAVSWQLYLAMATGICVYRVYLHGEESRCSYSCIVSSLGL